MTTEPQPEQPLEPPVETVTESAPSPREPEPTEPAVAEPSAEPVAEAGAPGDEEDTGLGEDIDSLARLKAAAVERRERTKSVGFKPFRKMVKDYVSTSLDAIDGLLDALEGKGSRKKDE